MTYLPEVLAVVVGICNRSLPLREQATFKLVLHQMGHPFSVTRLVIGKLRYIQIPVLVICLE